jgi:hypothetical protein
MNHKDAFEQSLQSKIFAPYSPENMDRRLELINSLWLRGKLFPGSFQENINRRMKVWEDGQKRLQTIRDAQRPADLIEFAALESVCGYCGEEMVYRDGHVRCSVCDTIHRTAEINHAELLHKDFGFEPVIIACPMF